MPPFILCVYTPCSTCHSLLFMHLLPPPFPNYLEVQTWLCYTPLLIVLKGAWGAEKINKLETRTKSSLWWLPEILCLYTSPDHPSLQQASLGWMIVVLQCRSDVVLAHTQWWLWPRSWWERGRCRVLMTQSFHHPSLPRLGDSHLGLLQQISLVGCQVGFSRLTWGYLTRE